MNQRTNGILLAISSLPSKYGIGDFGKSAYEFVDILKKNNVKIWQILPLNPLGLGNSPYQSICGYAIDPLYIDIEEFLDRGIIKNIKKSKFKNFTVEYDKVRKFKNNIFLKAFKNQNDTKKAEFKRFLKENAWVIDYAKFLFLLEKNNNKEWFFWNNEDKNAFYNKKFKIEKENKEKLLYHEWLQFIAFRQFNKLKKYLKKKNILLMGDIPFYVGGNSLECWSNQDEFVLDESDVPYVVSGVAPDYFSKDGQRWGNPIYDWKVIKDYDYEFFINRIKNAINKYDLLRIDHFRAFDSYYEIKYKNPTAIGGVWKKGPGEDFFNRLNKENLNAQIIAEDLGEMTPSVYQLRDKFNLPGMNIIQFSIFDNFFNMKENQIIYTGTHDNDTLNGFIKSLSSVQINFLNLKFKLLKIKGKNLYHKILRYVYQNIANCAIIPVQDILNMNSKYRMNTPGTMGSPNWEFKLNNFNKLNKDIKFIKELIKESNR